LRSSLSEVVEINLVIREGATPFLWAVVVATNSIRGLRLPCVKLIFPRASLAEKLKVFL